MELIRKIEIDPKYKRLYAVLRAFLYFFLILAVIVFFIKLIYPSSDFYFSFRAYYGAGNTISDPRDSKDNPLLKGKFNQNDEMIFNASVLGIFSKVKVFFKLVDSSAEIQNGKIDLVKAYRVFLYPEGKPVGFRDGSLLKNNNEYFIVSDEKLRKFSSVQVLGQFGYKTDSFFEVSSKDLSLNEKGAEINNSDQYPSSALFKIDEIYYQLKNNELCPFVSERAFLSQFKKNQAIKKDNDFFQKFPISEQMIGFLSGTIISYGKSVYIVENDQVRPVSNEQVFESKGYFWNSIIQATPEEFQIYTKGGFYIAKTPHPNGTILYYRPENKYYLIENGTKREIQGKNILSQYSSLTPVNIDDPIKNISCDIKKGFLERSYWCEIPLDELKKTPSAEYQFSMKVRPDIIFDIMEVKFSKNINSENLKFFLIDLKQKLEFRYTNG